MSLIEAEEAADREAARNQLAGMEAARRRFFELDGDSCATPSDSEAGCVRQSGEEAAPPSPDLPG